MQTATEPQRRYFTLENKVVVLTGGLGQLGRQFTSALLDYGAKVAVFDLRANGDIPDQDASNVMNVSVDVTSRQSLEEGLAAVVEKWSVPHALINNAALDSPPGAPAEENGPFESYPDASWDKVMQVNAKGPFLCSQVVGGAMAAEGRGSIVNICSIYGLVSPDQRIYEYRREKTQQPFFKPVAYSASKSALLNLTRYLATYWARAGVRVNTLTLGGVFNHQDEDFLKGYTSRVPVGRMAWEDDYNGAVIFLVSDASSYMTGSNLVVDGGWTAW
jgi:NAD(P)-dependent dehydrogenase (short-subunit alcohol dehydrogenase family)